MTAAEEVERPVPTSCLPLYVGQGAYGVCLSAISPTLVEAQKAWPMSYAQTALFPSLIAAAMVVAGLGYGRCAATWGRPRTLATAAGASAVGAVCVALAPSPVALLAAQVALGVFANVMLTAVMSGLADHGTEGRARRLTVGTVSTSLGSLAGPSLVTLAAGTATGWRGAWWVIAVGFAVLAYVLPTAVGGGSAGPRTAPRDAVLGRRFWLLASGVAATVAGEISLVYFAPQVVARTGLAHAGLIIMPYYLGELAGRTISSWLSHRGHTERPLLGLALLLGLSGFGMFWLADGLPLRVTGMLVAGLGVGNFMALGSSVVAAAAPRALDRAMSRLWLLVGAATLVAPLVLGALADRVGVAVALTLIPVLFLGILAPVLVAPVRRYGREGLPVGGAAR